MEFCSKREQRNGVLAQRGKRVRRRWFFIALIYLYLDGSTCMFAVENVQEEGKKLMMGGDRIAGTGSLREKRLHGQLGLVS